MLMQAPQGQVSNSPWEALARAGSQVFGSYLLNRADTRDTEQRQELAKLVGQAAPGGRDALAAALSGSQNPYAAQLGSNVAIANALQGTEPAAQESFKLETISRDGKPVLVQMGNRGTIKPVEGYGPQPEKIGKRSTYSVQVGNEVHTFDSSSGELLGRGPKWDPSGPASTKVSVTNIMPGEAKIPNDQRSKFADTKANLTAVKTGLSALRQFKPSRAESAAGSIGLMGPEGARADSARSGMLFGIAKLAEQGALQAPDKAVAEAMIGNIFDPLIGPESRAAKLDEFERWLDGVERGAYSRIETTPPEKAPIVGPRIQSVEPGFPPYAPQAPAQPPGAPTAPPAPGIPPPVNPPPGEPPLTPPSLKGPRPKELLYAAPQSGLPKAGDVKGGYRFKGGNPADKRNWEMVSP